MDKIIVYKDSFGKCCIVYPSPRMEGIMDLEEIAKASVPSGCQYSIIDKSECVTDRTFRDAWEFNKKSQCVEVNIDKAKAIHFSRIRKLRDIKLRELDVEQLKGNDVSKQKQDLRDLTKKINFSKIETAPSLSSYVPEEINVVMGQKITSIGDRTIINVEKKL